MVHKFTAEELDGLGKFVVLDKGEEVKAEINEVEVHPSNYPNPKTGEKEPEFDMSFMIKTGRYEGEVLTQRFIKKSVYVPMLRTLGLNGQQMANLINTQEGLTGLVGKGVTLTGAEPREKEGKKYTRLESIDGLPF